MRLTRKLTIALVFGILAVMAAYAAFQLRQEIVLSRADLQRARRIGKAWLGIVRDVWQHEGPARAYELAQRANEAVEEATIRLVPFAHDDGDPALPLSTEQRQALLANEVVRTVEHDAAGNHWAHIYVALRVGDEHPAIVEYIEAEGPQHTFIQMSHMALAAATLGVVAVCGLIAIGVQYTLVGRPLKQLRDKARRAGEGDFSEPLTLRQRDEMGELASEINAMCERIAAGNRKLAAETEARVAALEQLRHTDRLATVGQLAAGVAHELGTPLNVVSARAELIAAAAPARTEIVDNAHIIGEQCDRMTTIIHQLLDFSRRRGANLGLTDLRHVVTRTIDLLSHAAEKAGVDIQCTTGPAPLLVHVDQNQVQQALANIVLNGIQAMPRGGRLRVRIDTRQATPPAGADAADAMYACVCVEDQGAGIAPDHLSRVFEPFFTTKGVGEGTGLGLAVAHGIVAEHGGWIAADSTPGAGSRFHIFLPLAPAPAAAAGAA